ncbi:hypothetical protein EJ110_NYTH56642 [Nymphaea thermarum]|nr:hypothetical protein EJ110_NYTH56642 [Nymphaea thermarum]
MICMLPNLARKVEQLLSLSTARSLAVLNSPKLPLTLAARPARKAEARTIFFLASEDRSLHHISDLTDAAAYTIPLLALNLENIFLSCSYL